MSRRAGLFGSRILFASACLLAFGASQATAGPAPAPSAYQQEVGMGTDTLVARWTPFILEASKRFGVPVAWIRAVMMSESGGRTMAAEGVPMTSSRGAMGLMQVMPASWQEMRAANGLGNDPFDPHDNILAGAALLRELRAQYGYPGLFAAYNDGSGMVEAHRQARQKLPDETIAYVLEIAHVLRTGRPSARDPAVDPKAVDSGPQAAASDDGPALPVDYKDDEDSEAE